MNNYNTIYLAPHLDDVVLSCGGQIFEETQRGKRVLVVTIMAGDPPKIVSDYAQSLHTRWELAANTTAARRREDIVACDILEADTLHWQIPDCIYRTHPETGAPFYVSDNDIFGDIHPAEAHLVNQLLAQLAELPPSNQIIAPLTVGNHVDHQIVKRAAIQYFGARLEFYEDYPYVQTPGSLDFLQSTDGINWKVTVIPVSQKALAAKIEAILAYRSQISTFFTDRADLEQQVIGYANNVGGERIWKQLTINNEQ